MRNPHERFVKLAAQTWKGQPFNYAIHLEGVSTTGNTMAFADRSGLQAGFAVNPPSFQYVDGVGTGFMVGQAAGGKLLQAIGTSSWSQDGLTLVFGLSDGTIREYYLNKLESRNLPIHGSAPA